MVSIFEFSDNVVGILIKADMNETVFNEMRKLIISKFKNFNKLNLFVEIEKGNEISLRGLANHLNFQLNHDKKFDKIAVVTDKLWVKNVLVIKNLLMAAEVKTFSHKNRMEAIHWVAE